MHLLRTGRIANLAGHARILTPTKLSFHELSLNADPSALRYCKHRRKQTPSRCRNDRPEVTYKAHICAESRLSCSRRVLCHDVGVSIDWYSISIALTYKALRFKYLRAVRCKGLQALSGSSTFGPSLVLPSLILLLKLFLNSKKVSVSMYLNTC